MPAQPGLLAPPPSTARLVTWELRADADPRATRAALDRLPIEGGTLAGLGAPLVRHLGPEVEGLRAFPALTGPGVAVPSTQDALWMRLVGGDPGEALHAERAATAILGPAFRRTWAADGFRHADGRDLTGYLDGTENPVGDAAIAAALTESGSSFLAIQQWVHDLDAFAAYPEDERDRMIGRRRVDNVELEDAPASSHVHRTAQESFTPEAFVVRRSMPWSDGARHGLVFLAFGRSLDPFEAQLGRMLGREDGVVDALFRFTRPLTGGYYWCPPVSAGRLTLG